MIDYNARLSAAILGVGFALVQVQAVHALTKPEVSRVTKSITVKIQNAQNPQNTGSGVIIKREGEIYTVLTAHHVVEQAPDYKVMTPDDKLYPMIQDSIKPLPGVDLALVQFKSSESYSVAKMGDSTQSPSGSSSFVAGFSSAAALSSEPVFYFTSGEITVNASRPLKDGYALVYNNPTLPGMSGGPVLNEQGELIGIHGRGERAERLQNSLLRDDVAILKTEFNYAIPINTFLTLVPKVKNTLAFRTPSLSVPSAPKADDFFLQAYEKAKKGNYKGAIADYDQAISLSPKFVNAYIGRGVAHLALEDKKMSFSDFNKAVQLDPNSAHTYGYRGVARDKLGDTKGAFADFDQAVQLDPKVAKNFALPYSMGVVFEQVSGNQKGVIANCDRVIRLFPKNATAYYDRGLARSVLGNKQGAIADLQNAAALYKAQGDEKNYQAALKNLQRINSR
jgi:tetratricopeptide (TPR) repeat protein